MKTDIFSRALVFQLLLSVVTLLIVWPTMGFDTGVACVAGAAVSAADLWAIATLVRRLSKGKLRSRIFYTVALAAKLPLLILAVYLLVVVLKLEAVGLLIGFSTMVLAILYAGFRYQQLISAGDLE